MAKLINGNGNPAIYAAEDADLIASLAGNVTCIANVGNKYAATEEDATTIRLDDGVIITKEGRRIQLEAGESDIFYIPTGTSGQTNYYIIGYKLVQNADSTQVAEQFVQKMNSSSATITEDTFRGGAIEVYVSLYRVTQVSFAISSITGLLPELLDSNAAKDDIEQINNALIKITNNTTFTLVHAFDGVTNDFTFDSSGLYYIRAYTGSLQGIAASIRLVHKNANQSLFSQSIEVPYSIEIEFLYFEQGTVVTGVIDPSWITTYGAYLRIYKVTS